MAATPAIRPLHAGPARRSRAAPAGGSRRPGQDGYAKRAGKPWRAKAYATARQGVDERTLSAGLPGGARGQQRAHGHHVRAQRVEVGAQGRVLALELLV